MNFRVIKKKYLKYLRKCGHVYKKLNAQQIIESGIEFYQNERVYGTELERDEDMLLFQWGSFDWGNGKHFEVNITRQVIVSGDMYQLSITALYETSLESEMLGYGDIWCSNLSEVDDFISYIDSSGIVKATDNLTRIKSTINYEPV